MFCGFICLCIYQAPKIDRHILFAEAAVAVDAEAVPSTPVLHKDVITAVEWQARHTTQQIIDMREKMVCEIEVMAKQFVDDGSTREALKSADEGVRGIASAVNVPLLEWLVDKYGHDDKDVAKLFKEGAPLVGDLYFSGRAGSEAVAADATEKLIKGRHSWNASLQKSIKHSDLGTGGRSQTAQALLDLTKMDADLGRMTNPKVCSGDDEGCLFSKRFCLEQGTRPDGTAKLRPCDDATASWVNWYAQLLEKLRLENLSDLHQLAMLVHREFRKAGVCAVVLEVLKADVDSAFRRVPILPEHRKLAAVLFAVGNELFSSTHLALPFGFTGSVVAWERVGAAIATIIRRALMIGILRYVDDLFAVEQKATAKHALQCIARVVRAILGQSALADEKMAVSSKEVVLGIEVSIGGSEIIYRVPDVKKTKWANGIREALLGLKLSPKAASVLGGRLGFACQNLFVRLGRAMVRPIYERQHVKDGRAREIGQGSALHTALSWWKHVLEQDVVQSWQINGARRRSATVLCDAASTPPILAAAVAVQGKWYFTVYELSALELQRFEGREDRQITGLEIWSVALACATFSTLLGGCAVNVWSDNTGAECCGRKASAKAGDHNAMVHWLWSWAFTEDVELSFARVPTDDNVADGPTRGKFGALIRLGATYVSPVLPMCSLDWCGVV